MSFLSSLAVAIALAMDAFAVSVSAGASLRRVDIGHYLRMALTFGVFQAGMPVIGWALGISVRSWIEAWDHWIAFGLLLLVGLNMLREAFSGEEEEERGGDPSRGATRCHGCRPFLLHGGHIRMDARARHRPRMCGPHRPGHKDRLFARPFGTARRKGRSHRCARAHWYRREDTA